jgi:hypothetical protein
MAPEFFSIATFPGHFLQSIGKKVIKMSLAPARHALPVHGMEHVLTASYSPSSSHDVETGGSCLPRRPENQGSKTLTRK